MISKVLCFNLLVSISVAFQYPTSVTTRHCDRSVEPFKTIEPATDLRTSNMVRRIAMLKSKRDDSDDHEESSSSAPGFAWLFALVLPLHFVYISNQWSRSSLYYLVNFSEDATPFAAMNVDIGFSQSQYGLLASLAFTALFAFASLGAGAASDRFDRKQLTVVSAFGWGVATLGTALSSTYTEVLAWRVAMGLACAFTTPTAYTLINDRVPDDRKSFATSLYGTGVALGGALASLSILLDTRFGWQQTTMFISFVAFTAAILALVALPSESKDVAAEISSSDEAGLQRGSFTDDILEVLLTDRAKWLFLGAFLRFSAGLSIGVWSAPYFKMTFPDNASEYAVAQALITALAGSASGLLGGAIADWLAVNAKKGEDVVGKKLWIPVIGSILAAPLFYMAVHADSFQTAMVWLSLEYMVAECWFGPTISSMLATVGSKVGGTGQGIFTLTGAVANVAPTALGWSYSAKIGADASSELSTLLSSVVCFAYLACAVCFAISAQKSTTWPSKEKGA